MSDEPFRPSNSTEGAVFLDRLCGTCARDKFANGTLELHEAGPDDFCPLLAASMAYNVGDPNYPKEWVYRNGQPTCTAWCEHVAPGELSAAEKAAQGVLL